MELSKETYDQILSNLEETVILFSQTGEYLKVVGSVQSNLKEGTPDFIGKNIQETLSKEVATLFMSKITEAIKSQETLLVEYQIANISHVDIAESAHSTDVSYFSAKVIPIKDAGLDCVAWIASDISELKNLEINLQNSTVEDPVTGIFNRRFFFKELNNFFQRFVRGSNAYSIMMLSIDHSEKLSDTYGLEVTNCMVNNFINVIKTTLRTTDLFANTGDEDFIILLPDTPSNGAALMAERVRCAIESNIFELDGGQYNMTASFGCSSVSENDSSYDNVLNRAEIALYQSIHNGGNSVKRLDYENWNK
ncbi:MAG: hypothetical protein C0603_04075 [Denitrovibrio sp.]|nr:MAG: hypothetical protein C0603_04075 [Denitrovibrio sp.]